MEGKIKTEEGKVNMSILIRGMEMPPNCQECLFGDALMGKGFCWVYNCKVLEEYFMTDSKPSWCPLAELPPHGRLIDADALIDKLASTKATNRNAFGVYMLYSVIVKFIDESPTIVEPETCNESDEDGVIASIERE